MGWQPIIMVTLNFCACNNFSVLIFILFKLQLTSTMNHSTIIALLVLDFGSVSLNLQSKVYDKTKKKVVKCTFSNLRESSYLMTEQGHFKDLK